MTLYGGEAGIFGIRSYIPTLREEYINNNQITSSHNPYLNMAQYSKITFVGGWTGLSPITDMFDFSSSDNFQVQSVLNTTKYMIFDLFFERRILSLVWSCGVLVSAGIGVAYTLRVFGSKDGNNWTTLQTNTGSSTAGTTNYENITLGYLDYRFIRLEWTTGNGTFDFYNYSFNIFTEY